tara:strand:- start:232 stop:480 length:249 start_codon:yes stop_codon:yes gene_type:complete
MLQDECNEPNGVPGAPSSIVGFGLHCALTAENGDEAQQVYGRTENKSQKWPNGIRNSRKAASQKNAWDVDGWVGLNCRCTHS